MANKPYIINNFLMHIYHSLKGKERYVEEGKSRSFYEAFWDSAETAFVIPHRPSNSEVEAFYRGSLTMNEFIQKVQDRVLSKTKIKLDKDLKPLNSLSWSVYSTVPGRKEACDRVPKECALQLWTMFNKLDTECNGFVHTADLTELILKLYEVNNKEENEENIQEWFCSQMEVDFWSFFSALENHLYLIQRRPVEGLYKEVFHEVVKEGRMTKKGHKRASWRVRRFILTSTHLNYYDDNMVMKGSVLINENARVDQLPGIKGKTFLFRVTDGSTTTPYDICTPDSQIMQEWINALKVVIAFHSKEGRNYIHRMKLAYRSVFPDIKRPKTIRRTDRLDKSSDIGDSTLGVYQFVDNTRLSRVPSPDLELTHESDESLSPPPIQQEATFFNYNYAAVDFSNRQQSEPPAHQGFVEPVGGDQEIKSAYALLDHSPQPERHPPLRQVKSATDASKRPPPGYIQLSFGEHNSTVIEAPQPVKPLPPAKQKYGYSTVILPQDTEVSKDLDAAMELKKNRCPPSVPNRYGSSNSQPHLSPVTSSSSLNDRTEGTPPPPPPFRRVSSEDTPPPTPPTRHVSALSPQETPQRRIVDDSNYRQERAPPVPTPRSRGTEQPFDPHYQNVEYPPVPPARCHRRSDTEAPPVPPPR